MSITGYKMSGDDIVEVSYEVRLALCRDKEFPAAGRDRAGVRLGSV